MNSSLYPCPEAELKELCRQSGACAAGIARAGAVAPADAARFMGWLGEGRHGCMEYMARNVDLRLDPRRLFPGAMSVISVAFPYRPSGGYRHPLIADYALGQDYHRILKQRLAPVVAWLSGRFGALSRVAVDSAPVLERYWAVRAGVGFVGRNRQLIVPGVGSGVFLAEIITTCFLRPDSPLADGCGGCGRCLRACPGGALLPGGGFDARLCWSYLTVECRDTGFSPDEGRQVYGCDVCARVCPHNACEPPETVPEFRPDPRLLALDRPFLARITSGDFRRLFRSSAVSRVSVQKMRKNAKINKI